MLVGVESRELASLLSLISHEIRSPLGVVRGYLRMLNRSGGDRSDRHEQFITAALKASERAAEILAQVSTLAHLNGAEPPYDFKQVSLQGVVAGAASTIVLPTDPVVQLRVGHVEAVDIIADTGQLQGALASLLSSVIRAQGREVSIEISARREQRDGENGIMIQIMSTDTPATPSSTLPLNLSRGGLGLELPIAATIIDAHCGQVRELQSAGGYSGVTVWLPLETPGPETTPQ
jgi:signal transduction histidine kinase